jgi:hypothetical protein
MRAASDCRTIAIYEYTPCRPRRISAGRIVAPGKHEEGCARVSARRVRAAGVRPLCAHGRLRSLSCLPAFHYSLRLRTVPMSDDLIRSRTNAT